MRVLAYIDGRLHAAVITPRGERIRAISLRRANTREERTYAKERQSALVVALCCSMNATNLQ